MLRQYGVPGVFLRVAFTMCVVSQCSCLSVSVNNCCDPNSPVPVAGHGSHATTGSVVYTTWFRMMSGGVAFVMAAQLQRKWDF